MTTLEGLERELVSLANPKDAAFLQRYFKTGPGQYGEGDRFRGIRVPVLRGLARRYTSLGTAEALKLLQSPFHEDRLVALLILIRLYGRSDEEGKGVIYRLYLDH